MGTRGLLCRTVWIRVILWAAFSLQLLPAQQTACNESNQGKRGQPCWSACQKGEKVHVWWALERGDEALGESSRIYLHLAFIMHGRENTALMGRYWTAVNWSFLNWLRRRIGQRGFWEWGKLKLNPLWNAEDRRDWGIKQTQWWYL